jgi:hypothetical protein
LSSLCFGFQLELEQAAPPNAALNLVVVPLNYQDKQQFSLDVDFLFSGLKQTKPFNEFKADISLWRVDISQEEQEIIFKAKPEFPYLAVRQDFLDRISKKIKAPYKLVIINATSSTSCAEISAADKMSLIILGRSRYGSRNDFLKGFLHELGHSFGLRDEGLYSQAGLCPPGPPNCATTKEEAQKWWGDFIGKEPNVNYISGCCGKRDYIRPTIASLMNDTEKASDFGPVNERYLRKVLNE